VVGGKRDDDGAIIARQRVAGAGGDRRTGIAPRRLEQDVGLGVDGGKLLGDEEAVLTVGHHDRPSKQSRIGDPAHRLLKGRQRAEQRQELLGPVLARCRPQPRARAAAHDQGDDRLSQFTPAARARRVPARAAVFTDRERVLFPIAKTSITKELCQMRVVSKRAASATTPPKGERIATCHPAQPFLLFSLDKVVPIFSHRHTTSKHGFVCYLQRRNKSKHFGHAGPMRCRNAPITVPKPKARVAMRTA